MKHKILVVDDEEISRLILKKHLAKEYLITETESAIEAALLLRKEDFSVVITDINMPEVSGLDFLLWIKKHSIKTNVLIMTSLNSKEAENFANKKGALRFFKKPVNLNSLDKTLNSLLLEKGFSANIEHITLFDFIQMIILSDKNRRVCVSGANNINGYIYIKNNKIIHAEIDGLYGEVAFYKIMMLQSGSFIDTDWIEPLESTITLPYAFLSMEAARMIDEQNYKNVDNVVEKTDKKILVVDDNKITPMIINDYFSKNGYQVFVANSAIEGVEILKQEFISVVITDLHMPEVNGLEFLAWIKSYNPKTHVIIMTGESSEEIKKFAYQSGALNYFEKPVNLKSLESFVNNLFSKKFSGNVKEISLFDFIQITSFSRKNKLISVSDPINNTSGLLYLKEGYLIHAEFDKLHGENAFFAITQIEKGSFSELEWREPSVKTIHSILSSLIMKAMKFIDEKKESDKIRASMKENLSEMELSLTEKTIKADTNSLERILAQKNTLEKIKLEQDPIKKMTIYEFGIALEITLNKSDRKYVLEVMKKYSQENVDNQLKNHIITYNDISVTIIFNEHNIVEEISFGQNYKGSTNCGVKIGDTIDKTLKVYGKPKIATMRGYVWENISFFINVYNVIETIRLRSASL
ncbi:MAG: response regulator [Candidatus Sericytochromatia bacterium]|nr:response regulator [Candidatus Sericytochromatia bacterium]